MPTFYNVAKASGETMLGKWVDSPEEALTWLDYYQSKYGRAGKVVPYPNGKGHYPDFGFHIVKLVR